MARVEVVEYTDAVCSTAWGAEPLLRRLAWRHGHHLAWRKVMGGLVGDAGRDRADWDRVKAAEPMRAYWKRVWLLTGMPYPNPMHLMLRSTDPLGAAVKAAERQGQAVAAAYKADWQETREPNDWVRNLKHDGPMNGELKHSEGHDRYALPTVIFRGPGGEHTAAGWVPYEDYEAALERAAPGATADPRPDPTPTEAFATWRVLTGKELAFLCGEDAKPPAGVVAHDWGEGFVYFSAAEASARGLRATVAA